MSLQLILGGSGTGKSTRLYQMIVERSVQFPDEKTLLIVPDVYKRQERSRYGTDGRFTEALSETFI